MPVNNEPYRSRGYLRRQRIKNGAVVRHIADSPDLQRSLKQAESLFLQLIEKIDVQKIEVNSPNDLYKVMTSFAAIAKARTELERWTCEREGLLQEALERVCESMRNELASHPELVEQLRHVFDNVMDKLELPPGGETVEGLSE